MNMENVVCKGEVVPVGSEVCNIDIEKKSEITKYGLPVWILEAIEDWNSDYIYIKNNDNSVEIGTARVIIGE